MHNPTKGFGVESLLKAGSPKTRVAEIARGARLPLEKRGLCAGLSCLIAAAPAPLRSERLTTKRTMLARMTVVALLVATHLAPAILRAQESTGTVLGFVYDASTGIPVPQVQVEITGEVTVTATTANNGSFKVEGVPVGPYSVSYASANHQVVNVEGLEVVAGEIVDASAALSRNVESVVGRSEEAQQPTLGERELACAGSETISGEEICNEASPDASEAIETGNSVTTANDFVFVRALDPPSIPTARNSEDSKIRASGTADPVVESSFDGQSSKPQAKTGGNLSNPGAAIASRGSMRMGRKGVRIQSPGGGFTTEMHLRSQIRLSTPVASVPRKQEQFLQVNGSDLRFRRARFKTAGQAFRPWIQYSAEYDLVGTRLLDARVTVQKWEWLQFRFGQWKTEFGRERVSSSGRQEFADRSIVNRHFTADRQKGFMVLGRVKNGTWADSRYYGGVFSGNGRGFRSSGAGSLDNRDGAPMWTARYQWNFLKEDPGFSQSDLEHHEKPVAAIAVSALSNRSRFTRFSGSGGGRLDGFEVGLPGQFAVRQAAEDFVLKYRGLFLQHEFHWKKIRDRIYHRITSLNGVTVQGGYFPHGAAHWVPEQLELGLRYAMVDQDHARLYDMITESAFVVNWFMEGHGNKFTFDVSRYRLRHESGSDLSRMQIRVQWDVTL